MKNDFTKLKFQEIRQLHYEYFLFEDEASPLTEDDIRYLIEAYGGYWKHSGFANEPHPILRSGMHGGEFFDLSYVAQFSVPTEILSRQLARKIKTFGHIDWIIGPSYGASPFVYHLGNIFGCKHAVTEKTSDDKQIWTKYTIDPLERVQLLEDVITTGGSVFKSMAGIIEGNSKPVFISPIISAIVNRSGKDEVEGHKIITLLKVASPKQWKPEECELCKIGSKAIPNFKIYLAEQPLPEN